MDGVLLINKEKGITSRDVVNLVSQKLNTKRVGHTGTLDPLASGLMVLCVGEGLKLVELLTGHDKDYIAKVKLGIKTDTYDVTGNILEEDQNYHITKEELVKVLNSFNCEYEQVVPIYSSVKVNGKKLYEYARKGLKVELPKRLVRISNIKLLDFNNHDFTFSVTVSSGTYIRSLINDISHKLGVLMAMEELKRTRVGNFKLDDVSDEIISIIDAIDIKKIEVNDELFFKVSNGVKLTNIYHEDMVMFVKNHLPVAIYKNHDGILKSYRVFKC